MLRRVARISLRVIAPLLEDFALVRELGLEYLRYGPPYYSTHKGPGSYDWSFADETFTEKLMPVSVFSR